MTQFASTVRWGAIAVPWCLAPLMLFPKWPWVLFALAVPALMVLRRVCGSNAFPWSPLNVLILHLLVMVFVGLVVSPDLLQNLPKAAGLIFGVFIFFALLEFVVSGRALHLATVGLLALGLVLVGLSFIATRWTGSAIPGLGDWVAALAPRLSDIPGAQGGLNENAVAHTSILLVPFGFAGVWVSWNSLDRRRYVCVGAFGMLTVGLCVATFLSGSIAAWCGLLVAGVLIAFQVRRFTVGQTLGLALLAAIGGLLVISRGSFQARLDIWSRSLQAVQDFAITGMGLNVFRRVINADYPSTIFAPSSEVAHAHNHLIQAAVDLGLPGLVAFCALWVAVGRMAWMVRQASPTPAHRLWATALGAGLVAQFVAQGADAIALGAKAGIFWWYVIALVAALFRLTFGEAWDVARRGPVLTTTWLMVSAAAVSLSAMDGRLAAVIAIGGGAVLGWAACHVRECASLLQVETMGTPQ